MNITTITSGTPQNSDDLSGLIVKLEARHADLSRLVKLQSSVAALEVAICFGAELAAVARIAFVTVSRFYDVPFSRICSKSRDSETALARQIIFHLIRRHTHAPLMSIGKLFCRDHGTVMHAIRVISARKETDHKFAARMCSIERECGLRVDEMENRATVPLKKGKR